MSVDLTRLDDGAAFEAASLNALFTAFETGVTTLTEDALADRCFRQFHLPSGVPAVMGTHTVTVGDDGVLQAYAPALNTWVPVTDFTSGAALELIFSGNVALGMVAPDYTRSILALADVEIWQITGGAAAPLQCVSLAFALRDSVGAWATLTRSARPLSRDSTATPGASSGATLTQYRIPLATLITTTDLSTISGVRVEISTQDSTGLWIGATVSTKRGRLSVLPRRGATA